MTLEVARHAAELRSRHREGALRISDADFIMAAQAQLEQAVLVTGDRGLGSIDGVSAGDWDSIALD